MTRTCTFLSRSSSNFKERLAQIEMFLNKDQIRALESMKDVMIVEETDDSGNVVSLYVKDTHHTESTYKNGKIQTNSEVLNGENQTTQQWYDNQRLKVENLSLKNKVRDLEGQLKAAMALDKKRIEEINKRHGVSEHAETQVSMGCQEYKESIEASKKAEYDRQEVNGQKSEKAKLYENVAHLQTQLEISPEILLRSLFEDKKKELQEILGNEFVNLFVLAERLMDYAEEIGVSEAHDLFNHLNNLLNNVPAWTKIVPNLKNAFKKARKEMEGRNITMTGEHAVYNENK